MACFYERFFNNILDVFNAGNIVFLEFLVNQFHGQVCDPG
ncbi:Uncharacterised protein [uncultured archaeon]|nr:Uncharacterised protein [uncultured archaeon]